MVNDSTSNWYRLAAELTKIEAKGLRSSDGELRLMEFSRQTGHNPNMLRKMQRAMAFADTAESPEKQTSIKELPLSYVDILARTEAIDKAAARSLVSEVLDQTQPFNYRSLLSRYNVIRHKVMKGRSAAQRHKAQVGNFKKTCFEVARTGGFQPIYRTLFKYTGELKFRLWKGGHVFVSPYMTARLLSLRSPDEGEASTHNVDSYECFMQYESDPSDIARDRVLQSMTEATFFRCLWFLLPAGQVSVYEDLLEKLGPANVGVIRVSLDGQVSKCTLEPLGSPMPNRYGQWDKFSLRHVA